MPKNSTPLLSIIVPSYNNADLLNSLLNSLKGQSFRDYEIVLIDGNSSDHTKTVIETHSEKIQYSVSEKDKGIFDAMNKGINAAKGEWLYFMGCDDKFFNNDVLKGIFLQDLTNCDIIYGRILNEKKNEIEGVEIKNKLELLKHQFWHQSMFYRRLVFNQAGHFNVRYKIAADTEFNLKIFCLFDFKWMFHEHPVSIFSGTGISSKVIDKNYHGDQWNLYLKWFKEIPSQDVYKALQYNVYNEILIGNLYKAFYKLLQVMYHSRKIKPYLKHSLYWTKIRFSKSDNKS